MSALVAGGRATDTHIHVYDGAYPTAPTTVLRPADATVEEYRRVQRALGLERVVVVQPTTYGLDNRCQLAAMRALGDCARGVMVVDAATPRDDLRHMSEVGVRGARFHMLRGGAVGWDQLEPTAAAISEFGWHVQLQMDGRVLGDRLDALRRLPTPLVIDHVGRFMPPGGTSHPGFHALRVLLDDGNTWVKLSAPYESCPDVARVLPLVDELVARHADRLLWASNWPHPGQADPPDVAQLAQWCDRWLPDPEVRRHVLVDNAALVYDFD